MELLRCEHARAHINHIHRVRDVAHKHVPRLCHKLPQHLHECGDKRLQTEPYSITGVGQWKRYD